MTLPRSIPIIFIPLGLGLLLLSCGVSKSLKDRPDLSSYDASFPHRTVLPDSTLVTEHGWLKKNTDGLWELYVGGDPLQIGLNTGSLTRELYQKQEDALLTKVDEMVPSNTRKYLLRKFLAWFNRKMYLNVTNEYKAELYGLSKYAAPTYDHIAAAYPRIMYLHGAHDIGHAVQDLALVGCTSFVARDGATADGGLLVGRNFDFYAGDRFAQDKVVAFIEPDAGYRFMSVSWGGMIGVVSGMNDQGLTVTINAGKSRFPLMAKTPVSLVTREILQYAATIDEAIDIAKKRSVFVSESILVASARDHAAALIEVSPRKMGVYQIGNADKLVCSNHFQSDAFREDPQNVKQQIESHSQNRFDRMTELLDSHPGLTPEGATEILRNRMGLGGEDIGMGNEKALNHLLAHHGVVFEPEKLRAWVSSNPYQLGSFVGYDLHEVFDDRKTPGFTGPENRIAEDPFLDSPGYLDYLTYRRLHHRLTTTLIDRGHISPDTLQAFKKSNPQFWEVYDLIGRYNLQKGYLRAALDAFELAETKEITTLPDRKRVERYICRLKRRLNP